tara:strand:- start:134 stop:568 length:435 start_codon:yes stop_codon:yes gene_type:complete
MRNCLDDLKKSWVDLDKLSKVNENWEKLIGLELSKECKPLKIEQRTLTIAVNHPQWRQALIYNKHRLKDSINRYGINLNEIKIIQNYEVKGLDDKEINAKEAWKHHPSRIKNNNMVTCKICNCPAPKGEISRWGKCTFCWRKNN